MYYLKYIILSLFLTACVNSYTIGEVKVFDKQVDSTMTRAQAESLFYHAFRDAGWSDVFASLKIENANTLYWFQDALKDWDIVFTSGWLATRNGDSIYIANGLTDFENRVMYLRVAKCYGDTAFIHELGHIVRWKAGLDPDALHDDKIFWDAVNKMNDNLMVSLCHRGYTRDEPPTTFQLGE